MTRLPLLRVPLLAGALLAGAVLAPPQQADAAWTATRAAATGPLTTATLTADFAPLDGGTSTGTTFSVSKVLGMTTVTHVEVRNTSTVPLLLEGTVSLRSFLLSTTVSADSCALPWRAGACDGPVRTVLPTTMLASPRSVHWQSAPVPAGDHVHLRFTVGGSVANTLTATLTARPGRAGTDRTTG